VSTIGPGTVLSGRYRLERPLGTGATATVWRVRDLELGRSVALKLLDVDGADPDLADRFLREGRILGRLVHPNIVPVLAAGDDDGRPYLVMALIEGRTLRERVADGPLRVDEAVDVVAAVAAGLAEAHRSGVIHRDVKPGNIICGDDGQPRLVDFGIARASDLTTMTRADVVLGTAAYLAPEQALGDELGPATDVYALGCVLFELLTGIQPYTAASAVAVAYRHVHDPVPMPSAVRPEVPGALNAIVARCLAKRPVDRYHDAGAVGAALTRWRAGTTDEPTGALTAVIASASQADATSVLPEATAVLSGADATEYVMAPGVPGRHRRGHRAVVLVSGLVAALLAIALVAFTTDPGGSASPATTSTTTPVFVSTTTTAAPVAVTIAPGDGANPSKGKGKGKGGG
jgi:serine/threonine protein kinase